MVHISNAFRREITVALIFTMSNCLYLKNISLFLNNVIKLPRQAMSGHNTEMHAERSALIPAIMSKTWRFWLFVFSVGLIYIYIYIFLRLWLRVLLEFSRTNITFLVCLVKFVALMTLTSYCSELLKKLYFPIEDWWSQSVKLNSLYLLNEES